MRPIASSLLPLGLALLSDSAGAQVGEPAALRADHVAVELAPGAELDLVALAARLGVEVRSSRRWGPHDYRLIELTGALPAGPEGRALLLDTTDLPQVTYATRVWTGEVPLPEFPTAYVLVRFGAEVPATEQRAAILDVGGLAVEREAFAGLEGAWRLRSAARTGDELLEQVAVLAARPGVRWAQSDRALGGVLHDTIPNDPLFPQCWGLDNTGQSVAGATGVANVDMDAPAAWDLEQGDPGILVAVLDLGVDLNHPDLNLANAADFTGSGTGGAPVNGGGCHGTAVAGCVTAIIDNALGTAGVAPGCRVASACIGIPSITTCTNNFSASASWVASAIAWADQIGARVLNMSFSMSSDSAIEDALIDARAGGMIHFASSGNSFPSAIGFPANHYTVHAVGSVQSDGTKAPSSQTGGALAFSAPGVAIQTTDWQGSNGYNNAPGAAGDYTFSSGTSFASPYAAGVAALVLSRQPGFDPHDVWVALVGSTRELGSAGWDSSFGSGLLNAHKALLVADDMSPGYVLVDPIAPSPPSSYGTIAAAVLGVPSGGLVLAIPGSYAGGLLIDRKLLMRSWGTQSTIIGQ